MKTHYFHILFVFCVIFLVAQNTYSKKYATLELQEIGELLEKKPILHYEIVDTTTSEIVALGKEIFKKNTDAKVDPILYFIERYILHYYLSSEIERKDMLRDDKVELNLGKQHTDSLVSDFNIESDGKRMSISWLDSFMEFPLSYSLISGQNKKESDDFFYKEVVSFSVEPKEIENQVLPNITQPYIQQKGMAYLIPEINTDQFYVQSISGDLVPIFHVNYLPETVSNLFQSLVNSDYKIVLTQNLYGYKKRTFTISLSQLLNYCQSENCIPFVGIESEEENNLNAVVVFKNEILAYNHLLYVKISNHDLEQMEGLIYNYIPTHNLENLFND